MENDEEYTTQKLINICAVDNGWAADELEQRIKTMESALLSAEMLCRNLVLERQGWRRYVFGRWVISDEPLRNDAAHIMPKIISALRNGLS